MATQTTRSTQQNTITYIQENVMPIINGLDKKVDILANDVSHLKEDFQSSNAIVNLLRKELYGNGNSPDQPGLKATVLSLKKWIDDRSSVEKAVIIGAVLAVIGEIAGFIFLAIRISTLAA